MKVNDQIFNILFLIPGGPLVSENEEDGSLTLVGILYGGGIDCTKLGDDNYEPTKNGIWSRVSSFKDWIDTTIFNELLLGKKI